MSRSLQDCACRELSGTFENRVQGEAGAFPLEEQLVIYTGTIGNAVGT